MPSRLRPAELTLLTQHYYRASGASPISTAAFLISPDPQLTGELAGLQTGTRLLGLPYRISECNSFRNGGAAGVSNSYASSLWVIDFLFDVALSGGTGVNMHSGGQAPGYTPISDDSGAVIAARPEYYGLLFFALAGSGTLLETQLSAGSVDATAYAVRTASGGLNLIVVNKDEVQNLSLTIQTGQKIETATLQTDDRRKPGSHHRSHYTERRGEPERQFFPGNPRDPDSLCKSDHLPYSDAERGAYQPHLILSQSPFMAKNKVWRSIAKSRKIPRFSM